MQLTAQCKCGETINYEPGHAGRMARCARCTEAVLLPYPPPPPVYKSVSQLNREADRKRSLKLQLAALVAVIVVIGIALLMFKSMQDNAAAG